MDSLLSRFLPHHIFSWTTLLYAAVGYILLRYLRSIRTTYQFRAFETRHGSSRPIRQVNTIPWGIGRIYRAFRITATGGDLFDDVIIPAFYGLKTWTFETTGLLGQQIINTAEPKIVQAVFANNFKDFETGPTRAGQFGVLLGHKGILTTDGGKWERARKMFRPVFRRERINDLEGTERAAGILIDVLPIDDEKSSDGESWTEDLDLMPYFYRFTLDTATKFLFGQSIESQSVAAGRISPCNGNEEIGSLAAGKEFSDAFHASQQWMGYRIRMQGLYFLVDGFRWRRAVNTVKKFANHYVQQALEQGKAEDEKKKTQSEGEGDFNLLRELVAETRDPEELRDQILVLLSAGRDTTASLLSWAFAELARNPALYTTLRSSVLSTFGPASPSEPSKTYEPITFSTLKSHQPIQNFFSEILRLHPSVPLNNRVCVNDTILPVGGGQDGLQPMAVRKGQLVNVIIYLMHRRKDIWGGDAEEFKPDRWIGRKMGWEFVPFSGGPRVCLGQQYALTEASYLLVRLLQTFDKIEWTGEEGETKKGFALTMFPQNGVRARLRKAKFDS